MRTGSVLEEPSEVPDGGRETGLFLRGSVPEVGHFRSIGFQDALETIRGQLVSSHCYRTWIVGYPYVSVIVVLVENGFVGTGKAVHPAISHGYIL
jgi:hypothetical protein